MGNKLDEVKDEIAILYCKWCPDDCKGLTREERVGCLAAGGFVDALYKYKVNNKTIEELIEEV